MSSPPPAPLPERVDFGLEAIDRLRERAFDADGGLIFDRRTPTYLPSVVSLRQPSPVPVFYPTLEELFPAPMEFSARDFASVYLFNWPPIIRLLPVLKIARRLRSSPVGWLENMLNKSLPALVRARLYPSFLWVLTFIPQRVFTRLFDLLPHTDIQVAFLGAFYRAILCLEEEKRAPFLALLPATEEELTSVRFTQRSQLLFFLLNSFTGPSDPLGILLPCLGWLRTQVAHRAFPHVPRTLRVLEGSPRRLTPHSGVLSGRSFLGRGAPFLGRRDYCCHRPYRAYFTWLCLTDLTLLL